MEKTMAQRTNAEVCAKVIKDWALDKHESHHKYPFDAIVKKRGSRKGGEASLQSSLSGASFVLEATCDSCLETKTNRCTWKGMAGYWKGTRRFVFYQRGHHSPLGQRKRKGSFSNAQCWVLKDRKRRGLKTGAWAAQVQLSAMDMSPPDNKQILDCFKNSAKQERKKKTAMNSQQPKSVINLDLWRPPDFEAAWRHESLSLRCPGGLDKEMRDQMEMIDFQSWLDAKAQTCCGAVVSKWEMLATAARLANKGYIKSCCDGRFKLTYGGWCTLPLGFFCKEYSKTTMRTPDSKMILPAWTTRFVAQAFVIATSESAPAYRMALESIGAHIDALWPGMFAIGFLNNVRQFLADLSPAAELAREQFLPAALRASDYWHLKEAMAKSMER